MVRGHRLAARVLLTSSISIAILSIACFDSVRAETSREITKVANEEITAANKAAISPVNSIANTNTGNAVYKDADLLETTVRRRNFRVERSGGKFIGLRYGPGVRTRRRRKGIRGRGKRSTRRRRRGRGRARGRRTGRRRGRRGRGRARGRGRRRRTSRGRNRRSRRRVRRRGKRRTRSRRSRGERRGRGRKFAKLRSKRLRQLQKKKQHYIRKGLKSGNFNIKKLDHLKAKKLHYLRKGRKIGGRRGRRSIQRGRSLLNPPLLPVPEGRSAFPSVPRRRRLASNLDELALVKRRERVLERKLARERSLEDAIKREKFLLQKRAFKYSEKYPKTCACVLVPTNSNSNCYYFTDKLNGYCVRRQCRASYSCVHGRDTGVICMRRLTSTKIVPLGGGTCYTKPYSSYMYVPYSYGYHRYAKH